MKKVRCLFVWPKANSLMGADNWPLYGSLAVATYAQAAGAEVTIIDRRRANGIEEYSKSLPESDLVLVAATTADIPDANLAIQEAKNFGKVVVIGGVHATALESPFEDFPLADCAVRGDGMAVIATLIDDFRSRSLKRIYKAATIGSAIVQRLDRRIPDRSLLPNNGLDHPLSIVTEIGCPNSCSFCFDANSGTYRRNPKQVVKEIAQSGENTFFANFDDNLFGADPEGARSLARAIKESGLAPRWFGNADITSMLHIDILRELREAGMGSIYIGFETIFTQSLKRSGKATLVLKLLKSGFLGKSYTTISDQLIIDLYAKITETLHEIGFTVYCGLIFGWPEETLEDIDRMIEFAKSVPDVPWLSIVTPYPGTGIRRYFEQKSIKMKPYSSGLYDTNHLVFEHPNMAESEVIAAISKFYSFNGSESILAQKRERLSKPQFAKWASGAVESNLTSMRKKAQALYSSAAPTRTDDDYSSFSVTSNESPSSLI